MSTRRERQLCSFGLRARSAAERKERACVRSDAQSSGRSAGKRRTNQTVVSSTSLLRSHSATRYPVVMVLSLTVSCCGSELRSGSGNAHPRVSPPITCTEQSPTSDAAIGVHLVSMDSDDADTCGRASNGAVHCWGRPTIGTAALDESGLSNRAWLHQDAAFFWSHSVPTYQHARFDAPDRVSENFFQTVAQFISMRHPKAYRSGWSDRADEETRIHLLVEDDQDIYVPRVIAGITLSSITRTSTGYCALDTVHTLRCPNFRSTVAVERLAQAEVVWTDVAKVSVTTAQTCVLRLNGEVWCSDAMRGAEHRADWSRIAESVSEMVTTRRQVCTQTRSGLVYCSPLDQRGGLALVSSICRMELPASVVQIVAGEDHVCARTERAEVLCWGEASYGRLGTQPSSTVHAVRRVELNGAVQFASAGWGHTCVLTRDQSILCWGLAYDGQTGDSQAITPRAHSNIARYRTTPFPRRVELPSAPTQLRSLSHGACVVIGRDRWCWGNNHGGLMFPISDGRLVPAVAVPVRLSAIPAFLSDANFQSTPPRVGHHECVVTSAHRVQCRGNNGHGQLGVEGPSTDQWTLVPQLADIVGVTNGGAHSCAWNRCGSLYCWGSNDLLQLSLPRHLDPNEPHLVVEGATSP